MDYADYAQVTRHSSWNAFKQQNVGKRVILLTTKTDFSYTRFEFSKSDILLLGQESSGVPDEIHKNVDARVTIPMQTGMRSVNIAVAAAMVVGEALRQTASFPSSPSQLEEVNEPHD